MMNPVRVFERLTLTAPLGLVFHDTATGLRVTSGLAVEVYLKRVAAASPPGSSASAVPTSARAHAHPNPSGVYVLHHAPGLGPEFEFGAGDDEFWANLPAPRTYVVEVSDTEGRFLPFSFEVDLPLAARGLYEWYSPLGTSLPAAGSPPEAQAPTSVPLYSAPTRRVPPGFAALRADLLDASRQQAAAHAVVEARVGSLLVARGLSDEQGRLALLFPHPAPPRAVVSSPVSSPPAVRGQPLLEQSWDLTLRAGYTGEVSLSAAQGFADLRQTLEQLLAPPAHLWADRVGGEELSAVRLEFGRELVLRTQDPVSLSPPARQSALLITPAGSPP